MKATSFASAALCIALASAGCMEDVGKSISTSTGTSVEALHPAALLGQATGSAPSGCSALCGMLDGCGLLLQLEISLEECIGLCGAGTFDEFRDCLLASTDCSAAESCFW